MLIFILTFLVFFLVVYISAKSLKEDRVIGKALVLSSEGEGEYRILVLNEADEGIQCVGSSLYRVGDKIIVKKSKSEGSVVVASKN